LPPSPPSSPSPSSPSPPPPSSSHYLRSSTNWLPLKHQA
jgi:hypothetical protein